MMLRSSQSKVIPLVMFIYARDTHYMHCILTIYILNTHYYYTITLLYYYTIILLHYYTITLYYTLLHYYRWLQNHSTAASTRTGPYPRQQGLRGRNQNIWDNIRGIRGIRGIRDNMIDLDAFLYTEV
jgi:hypothetical protein